MSDTTQTFNALIREATFTKEVLCAGATLIRKANYTSPGVYAQAFSALSIGLERIGKLCLMLDHYIENSGRFPDHYYLKNNFGHKLNMIQAEASGIVKRRQTNFRFLDDLERPIDLAILKVLHDYADGDRYSNINILTGARQISDPITAWFKTVDSYIFEHVIGTQRKSRIKNNADLFHEMMSGVGIVRHTAESGATIDSYVDASFRTGMFEAVAPYRQLYVLQIVRYWVELLWQLGDIAQSLGRQEIPFFGEIFAGFYNDDAFFKTRKTWNF